MALLERNLHVAVVVTAVASPLADDQQARGLLAAALAPADPSPQDLRVAARATAMETDARAEMARETRDRYQPRLTDKGFGAITTEIAEALVGKAIGAKRRAEIAGLGLKVVEAYPGQPLARELPGARLHHTMSAALRVKVKETT